ncbi:hypothetical protein [Ensifer soli]|uniref:hypothetical protein n=1 Tax=Ciceribacter sp. sgz301302 TaxID=3342379 RepID=UPI0035BA9D13
MPLHKTLIKNTWFYVSCRIVDKSYIAVQAASQEEALQKASDLYRIAPELFQRAPVEAPLFSLEEDMPACDEDL